MSPSVVKQYRLNRLFHPTSGRCFDVAVDHGMPGEAAMLTGIEDMEKAIDTLVDAKPDEGLIFDSAAAAEVVG